MSELLLELFSEEIPARMQARAAEDLKRLITGAMAEAGLAFEHADSYATPRRLTLVVAGLPKRQSDTREERKGPRVGAPEKALQGFLRGAGLTSLEECEIREDKRGRFYVAIKEQKGRSAKDVLAEIIPAVIGKFPWPKSMRWGSGNLRWVRPLHSILCVFGPSENSSHTIEFAIEGIKSGDTTYGHRFLAPGPFKVRHFKDYEKKLEQAFVVLDPKLRRERIWSRAVELAEGQGLEAVEDNALLDEVAGLVEWPAVLLGRFDENFLDLPAEVLESSMRKHQKYFSLRRAGTGKAANAFIVVANLAAKDGGKAITAGNERVLNARLADARFFWDQDLKTPLSLRTPELDAITFHAKLGSQGERVRRIAALARDIAPFVDANEDEAAEAANLCKTDLVTQMVGEFPDLQGLMGKYYAEKCCVKPYIAKAIEDHYKPQGPKDAVPKDPIPIAVALADKIDTLVGFWAIDEKPTGSKDPYALRRAALGIIRIILENELRLNLQSLLDSHYLFWMSKVDTYELSTAYYKTVDHELNEDLIRLARAAQKTGIASKLISPNTRRLKEINNLNPKDFDPLPGEEWIARINEFTKWQGYIEEYQENFQDCETLVNIDLYGSRIASFFVDIRDDMLTFFADRLKVYLRDQGARHDLIDAVFALGDQDDLLMIVRRVEALGAFLETEDGANLLAGVKRASNILRIEEKKDKRSFEGAPEPALFAQNEEKTLFERISQASAEAKAAVGGEDFARAMAAMATLRGPVDNFFDAVTVNTDDPLLRENRLKLLSQIRAATREVADFSRISG